MSSVPRYFPESRLTRNSEGKSLHTDFVFINTGVAERRHFVFVVHSEYTSEIENPLFL